MCGIAGFYGFRDDNLIKKFSEQLSHRGPDGEGFYIDSKVSLLNRRLAIIDRKGGDQPIFNEDKTVAVTYNGEIYNYEELQKILSGKGHIFKTKSDTEVIVHGYEEWGDKCFDRFNGMFAVGLYDIKKKKLILARDHFGIKPLYYALLNKDSESKFLSHESLTSINACRIIFSSEIKPLFYSGLIKKDPNDRIIYRYLRYRIHDDQRETFFERVYRLMPGEQMIMQNDKFQISKYTNLEEELLLLGSHSGDPDLVGGIQNRSFKQRFRTSRNDTKSVNDFREKLIEAVRLRLISEVPVGTCLSGGLDSSTVVSIVNKLLGEKVKEAESVGKIQNTFSAVFPGGSNNEEKYIDELVKSQKSRLKGDRPLGENLKSHKIYPKPEEFFNEIEEFVQTQEEPTISTGPYAQYKVMQEAHKYVTVLLDGQGVDEMMAGYIPYYFVYLRQLWKEKRYFLFLKEFIRSFDVIFFISLYRYKDILGIKKNVEPANILEEKFRQKFSSEKFTVENYNLKKRLIEDIFSNSLPALLRYEDKNSMRFSIEARVPFLDSSLLRYLFSLPDDAIIKNGWNKYILRQSIKDLLPALILKRRNKIGFTTPEYEWFMRMKNKIYSIFLSESFSKRKYFNQQEVLKAFQMFIEGKADDTMLFWRLINVEIWMRVFIDIRNLHPQGVAKNGPAHPEGAKRFLPNEGKKLEMRVEGKTYLRFPIKTEIFKKSDEVSKKIGDYAIKFLSNKKINYASLDSSTSLRSARNDREGGWFIVVSEKIVAIAQGRSHFIWDIKTGFWANLLAKFVKKTPYGIGLGSPWTMQLAINDIGLPRILLAAFISIITKPLGFPGLFYKIAGQEAASIDGPTEYSLYPSNVSAKLGPKNPERVSEQIHGEIAKLLNGYIAKKSNSTIQQFNNFLGVVIIDANDLGQKVLGNSTGLDNKLIEKIFSDNPMGQADEQTPLVLVFEEKSSIISP